MLLSLITPRVILTKIIVKYINNKKEYIIQDIRKHTDNI